MVVCYCFTAVYFSQRTTALRTTAVMGGKRAMMQKNYSFTQDRACTLSLACSHPRVLGWIHSPWSFYLINPKLCQEKCLHKVYLPCVAVGECGCVVF